MVTSLMPRASTWQGPGAWQVLVPLCLYLTQCQDLNHMLRGKPVFPGEALPGALRVCLKFLPTFPWPYSQEKVWRKCLKPMMFSPILVTKTCKENVPEPGIFCRCWTHGIRLIYILSHLNWRMLVTPHDIISKSLIRA